MLEEYDKGDDKEDGKDDDNDEEDKEDDDNKEDTTMPACNTSNGGASTEKPIPQSGGKAKKVQDDKILI